MKKNKNIQFTKMSGAGNDFLLLEVKPGLNYKRLAPIMCDRTNGIGADGLLILDSSRKADFRMRVINADGSEAEMCGNGIRCMAAYIIAHRKPKKKIITIETLAGIIQATAKGKLISACLSRPKDYRPNLAIEVSGKTYHVHFINTGVPHAVIFIDNLANFDVNAFGPQIRYHKAFSPAGTNVDLIEQIKPGTIAVRTYERGVEAETKACGTGSVASAIISALKNKNINEDQKGIKSRVITRNGDTLAVSFDIQQGSVNNVWLTGPARFIAKGEFIYS